MAIPAINVLGNPNVTEGNFQIAIEDLRKSVIGSGKAYDSSNTYSQYDTCVSGGVVYYSKINSNTGNTPAEGVNWGLIGDLITGVVHNVGNETIAGTKTFSGSVLLNSISGILGYTDGSGSSVSQLTNKNTSVFCPSPTGTIVTNNSALARATSIFTVFNPLMTENCTVQTNCKYAGGGGANYEVDALSNNSGFLIRLTNKSTVSLSETVYITYTILKGTIV